MQLHHDKHHAAYVTNLNSSIDALEVALEKQDLNKIIHLQKLIKFNGGGHINHSIFWKNLMPQNKGGGDLPLGDLRGMIESQYGSQNNLQVTMSTVANAIQGSGWAWLGYDQAAHRLGVAWTKNQTPLLPKHGLVPLLGIDVWEHAFYPQYKNARAEYVKNIWNIINWKDVEKNLADAGRKEDK
eukprot:gene23567-29795_t